MTQQKISSEAIGCKTNSASAIKYLVADIFLTFNCNLKLISYFRGKPRDSVQMMFQSLGEKKIQSSSRKVKSSILIYSVMQSDRNSFCGDSEKLLTNYLFNGLEMGFFFVFPSEWVF